LAKRRHIQLAENALREGLAPLDEMEAALALLEELGGSQVKLAEHLGVAESTISGLLKLGAIFPAVRAAVRAAGKDLSRRQLWQVAAREGEAAQLAALQDLLSGAPGQAWERRMTL
jgi:ParB-like chromosome segregation protein Spo0J